MKLVLLLAVVAWANARVAEDCSGVVINTINHVKEVLKHGLDSPYQLSIDYDTNTLFFSYSDSTDKHGFKSAYLNLKTNQFGVIRGIEGGFASAVDGKNHIVYLGGNNGIYTYDFNTKKAVHQGANDKSIWQMFYKNKLYYTEYPSETAYTFENGVVKKVPELDGTKVTLVALDKNDNYVYSNSSGLFYYKKDKETTVQLGDYNINGFATDENKDTIYFSTHDGIYSLNENGQTVTKLTELDTVYGIAIEADNKIIYADSDSIVRLNPTSGRCFSNTKL